MITKEQFGFNAFWWEKLHAEEQIKSCVDYLANIGYKYVEFKRDSFLQDKLGDQFKLAVKIAESGGLKVSNFVVLGDLTNGDPKMINNVIETITACSDAGIRILNSVCGGLPEPIPGAPENWWMPAQSNHQVGWDNVVMALEKICDVADRYQVDLAIEPIVGTLVRDYYSMQELFRLFDHPRLCLTMDPSHLLLHRNDIPYAIRQWKDKIIHVHMKDAVGRPGTFGLDFLFPSLGAGAIDWEVFFNALEEINYTGAINGEYEQFKYMEHVRNNDPKFAPKVMYKEMSALYHLAYK